MTQSFEKLAELRNDSENKPETRTVIPGYYALSDKDRETVDKHIRKFRKAIANNEQPSIDFNAQSDE